MANHKPLFYVALAITIFLWATAYTLVGYIVDYIAPAWIVAARTFIAAILLIGYALMRGHKFPTLRDPSWLWYGIMGIIGMAIPFYLFAKAQIHVDSGLAAVLAGFMPLITVVLAHFFIKGENLTTRKGFGFVIGFIGVVILFLPTPFRIELIANWKAQSLIILAASCYAALTIITKRAPEIPASVGAAIMLIAACIITTIAALSSDIPNALPPQSAIIALFALAIGSTGIANILYLRIVQISGPTLVAKMNYIIPVVSIIAGIVFLDEPFQWRSVLALFVIVLGLFVAKSRQKKT